MTRTSASSARIAASPDRKRSVRCRALAKERVASLTAASPRLRPEEPPKAASRRMRAAPCFERRTSCAPQHEAGRERAKSYPPAQEDILVELGPVLVFANVVGPVGEIEPLELGAGACGIAARGIVAELLIEQL